jgi:hypothetical protein
LFCSSDINFEVFNIDAFDFPSLFLIFLRLEIDMDAEQLIQFVNTVVFSKTQRYLQDVEVWILEGAWNDQTYEDIALSCHYSPRYLSQDIGPKFWKFLSTVFKEEIKKSNFRTCLERHFHNFTTQYTDILNSPATIQKSITEILPVQNTLEATFKIDINPGAKYDWGEAPDIAQCFGRERELQVLEDLFFKRSPTSLCPTPSRLMLLLGMGGIGKTILCCQLAQKLSTQFDAVIWRSLRNTPNPYSTVKDWLQQLCSAPERLEDSTFAQNLQLLLDCLRQHRCLLILDNFDSVLEPGSPSGAYRPHLQDYGLLLRSLADIEHNSCLMLTCRTQPKGIMERVGTHLSVHSYRVPGLQTQDIMEVFNRKGCYGFNRRDIESLTTHYAGNPAVLGCFATMVQELTAGNIADFLAHFRPEELHFNELGNLLQQQLSNLTTLEKKILHYLASLPTGRTLAQLINAQHLDVPKQSLIEGMQSLLRRSLVELKGKTFSLPPYVSAYVKAHLSMEAVQSEGSLAENLYQRALLHE